MFKNSFWIHLKGTRGLHLPRAVTRIQKPAMGRRAGRGGGVAAGLVKKQPGEERMPGSQDPREAEDPVRGLCMSLCLSVSLLQPLL